MLSPRLTPTDLNEERMPEGSHRWASDITAITCITVRRVGDTKWYNVTPGRQWFVMLYLSRKINKQNNHQLFLLVHISRKGLTLLQCTLEAIPELRTLTFWCLPLKRFRACFKVAFPSNYSCIYCTQFWRCKFLCPAIRNDLICMHAPNWKLSQISSINGSHRRPQTCDRKRLTFAACETKNWLANLITLMQRNLDLILFIFHRTALSYVHYAFHSNDFP